jgi:glutathione synthase/RimK-type ligase-like ATP-grasp enzyme
MKQGEYIVERLLPAFVERAAVTRGITFRSFSEDWVLRLQRDTTVRYVVGYQFDHNLSAMSAVATDKVATSTLLSAADVPVVEHILVRSTPHETIPTAALAARFSGPFVIKPLDGSGGRGVQIVATTEEAQHVVLASGEIAWAASPLLDVAAEYRVILLDETPLVVYEKTHPVMHHGLKMFNLGMGAHATDMADSHRKEQLEQLASAAARALSLRLASIDIVQLRDGSLSVLEVNDGIMMENYARQSAEYNNRAAQVYDAIVEAMFR